MTLHKRDRRLLISAILLLGMIKLGLRLLPFQTWRRLLARKTQKTFELQKTDPICINKVVWAVEVASQYMPGGVKCLARGLATQVLLGRRGYQAQLRIGVAIEGGQLEAHAWVESQGTIVIGGLKDLARYTPLPMEAERS